MKPKNTCPLSPALISLLQACVDARCIRNQTLADHLCQSADTAHTSFRRIAGVLGTHDRFEAICVAYENGWIRFAPSLDLKYGFQIFHKQIRKNCPQSGAVFLGHRLLYFLHLKIAVDSVDVPVSKGNQAPNAERAARVSQVKRRLGDLFNSPVLLVVLMLATVGLAFKCHAIQKSSDAPILPGWNWSSPPTLFSSTTRARIADVGLDC